MIYHPFAASGSASSSWFNWTGWTNAIGPIGSWAGLIASHYMQPNYNKQVVSAWAQHATDQAMSNNQLTHLWFPLVAGGIVLFLVVKG